MNCQCEEEMRVRRQRGFTLIELLVVLAILAMLAAIVVPRVFRNLEKAKVNTAKTQIAAFESAISAYRLDVGSFPTTDQGLQALRTQPGGVENWDGPYLPKDIPADPWGHPYVYRCPSEHGDYEIISYGADGREGGDGVNKDIESWK
jgi:general secretion pathway protein G